MVAICLKGSFKFAARPQKLTYGIIGMFTLILSLVSIALVACLAIASLYYGGSVFSEGAVSAHASQLLAEANQIQGAVQMFVSDHGRNPSGPAELVAGGEYLKSLPASWGGGPSYLATTPTSSSVSLDSCRLFNERRLGISTIPSCTDPLYIDKVVCCEEPPVFANP